MPVKLNEREVDCQSLFRHLSADELACFMPFLRRCSLPAGKTIITMGQSNSGVYLLMEGAVKICIQQHGGDDYKEVILNVCGVGEVLGEMDALSGRGHSATVVTAAPSHFLWISTEDFRSRLSSLPGLNFSLNSILAERLQKLSARESAHAVLNLEGRLARQLLLLARDHGIHSPQGIAIPLHLTQRDLASMVGSTRERVNQALSRFKKKGLVDADSNGRLRLCHPSVLGEYCRDSTDSIRLLQDVVSYSAKRSTSAPARGVVHVKVAVSHSW